MSCSKTWSRNCKISARFSMRDIAQQYAYRYDSYYECKH